MANLVGKTPTFIPSSQASAKADAVVWIRIGADADGQRLDNYLFRIAKGVPKSHLYRIKRATVDTRLQLGDELRVPPIRVSTIAKKESARPIDDIELPILYEDEHILVVDKPAGLAAHGGSGVSFGLIERLRAARPNQPYLELVHRLDRDTSGVMMLAKSRKALVRLHEMIRNGGIFQLIERFGAVSYLNVDLKTGRTHQIRVHAQWAGHPLVGDDKYGDFEENKKIAKGSLGIPFKRMFLHAYRLEFKHPISGRSMSVTAQLPKDCAELITALKQRKEQ